MHPFHNRPTRGTLPPQISKGAVPHLPQEGNGAAPLQQQNSRTGQHPQHSRMMGWISPLAQQARATPLPWLLHSRAARGQHPHRTSSTYSRTGRTVTPPPHLLNSGTARGQHSHSTFSTAWDQHPCWASWVAMLLWQAGICCAWTCEHHLIAVGCGRCGTCKSGVTCTECGCTRTLSVSTHAQEPQVGVECLVQHL